MITLGQALWIINNIPQNPSSTSIMPSVWQNSRRQVLEELQAIVDAEQSVHPTLLQSPQEYEAWLRSEFERMGFELKPQSG